MPRPRRKPERTLVALIGDVVESRELDLRRRKRVQLALQEQLEVLNRALGPEILAARITLTGGDEVQALLRRPGHVVEVVRELSDVLFQAEIGALRMRFGVGRGSLTTGPVPTPWAENPALLDGPAFHHAREALTRARDRQLWACFEGLEGSAANVRPRTDLALEALFALMGSIREDWTERQGRVSILFRKLHSQAAGGSQSDLARELRVSPSVISETLKAARHNLLLLGEEAAVALLEALEEPR